MGKVEIRCPGMKDTAALERFFSIVITHTFEKEGLSHLKKDIEDEIISKSAILREALEAPGDPRVFFIALDGNRIIGTIEFGPSSDLIRELTGGRLDPLIEVGTVFVHPDYQGRGIGSLLWNTILLAMMSKGITKFCLDSGYIAAQKIWRKKFGEPDYVLKDYWGAGHSHMIWCRTTREIPVHFSAPQVK